MKPMTAPAFALSLLLTCMAAHAATLDVYVFNNEFSTNQPGQPLNKHAVITKGDTVRWLHLQGNHTTTSVVGSPEQWNAPLSNQNKQYLRTFMNEGVFVYYCIPHGSDNGDGTASGMWGTITVLAPESGACCLGGGACNVISPADCAQQDGVYQGADSTCDPNPCGEDPTGACCFNDASCDELTALDCDAFGGTYQGNDTMCHEVSCPIALMPYVDELPRPGVAQPLTGSPGGAAHYEISMTEQFQKLHRDLPPTRVWGYSGSYPGPTIEAWRDETVTVVWTNDLREHETGMLRTTHPLVIDECLHGPHETGQTPVAIVHLHGGKISQESDGYPEWAFPPGEQSPVYTYPNDQPAATIWYHDHALGITRLNVMMGMAGFYILRDDDEAALNLPSGDYEIPMAIQDRSFNNDGSIKYHEMWHEHFFGDVMLVNGKVWPYLEVDRGKYRLRTVNGCNSRALTLALSNGATFWQIGSDLGLLEAPAAMTQVTLLPGERADLIFDFAPYAPGTELLLTNSAPAPFPGFPGVGVLPDVMKFIVQDATGHTDPLPDFLVEVPRIAASEAVKERLFELRVVPNVHCPEHHDGMWVIDSGNGMMMWDDISEFPVLDTVEIWTWKNDSGISHPMHLHLVMQQVLDRQAIDPVTGQPTGPKIPPPANEMGWKDTVDAPPGYFTRVIMRFEGFTGRFPFHCHILEHEDHEMMRQFEVVPPPPIPGDLTGDGKVGVPDLLVLLANWGPCADCTPGDCPADLTGDCAVGVPDLLILLANWG